MKIKVLITGGTIDKVYNASTGEMHYYRFFQLSYIADALPWKYFSKK
jgi:L-asparaginase/Glu-tRNA(Gln) amidotransferase subunit D